MIDHTRAFRTAVALQKKNALPERVDHKLLSGLRKLNTAQMQKELGSLLTTGGDQLPSWDGGI